MVPKSNVVYDITYNNVYDITYDNVSDVVSNVIFDDVSNVEIFNRIIWVRHRSLQQVADRLEMGDLDSINFSDSS